MPHTTRRIALVTVLLAVTAASAKADAPAVAATALDVAGFDLIGNRNPLSGGIDFQAVNDFDPNAPYDFGAWDITLDGPISLDVSTGGRLLSQFDLSFTTALDATDAATPLGYAYNFDLGPQSTQVTGTVFADVDFSLNKLGYYDLGILYSSRQNVIREGQFANSATAHDLDVGPIALSGNVYADALAILTDPFFDRAGTTNVFAQFSGERSASALLTGSSTHAQEDLAADAGESDAAALRTSTYGWNDTVAASPLNTRFAGAQALGAVAVPEPAVLVLLLLGVPALFFRQRRSRGR